EITKVPRGSGPLPAGAAYRESLASVIDGRWHYFLHENGSEELYDLERDPGELANLASTREGIEERRRLKAEIVARRTPPPPPRSRISPYVAGPRSLAQDLPSLSRFRMRE